MGKKVEYFCENYICVAIQQPNFSTSFKSFTSIF